jgi:hypothetical protein
MVFVKVAVVVVVVLPYTGLCRLCMCIGFATFQLV